MRDDTLSSIGLEAKYDRERIAATQRPRTKPLDARAQRRQMWLTIGGFVLFLLAILGMCACMARLAFGPAMF